MKLELSHDILAKRIFDKISTEDKMRLKIQQLLADRMDYYNERKVLLSKGDLAYISPFLESIALSVDEQTFVDKSVNKLKQKKRRKKIFIVLFVLLLVACNFQFFSEHWGHMMYKDIREKEVKVEEKIDSINLVQEAQADTMLQRLNVQNDSVFVKKLLASYDTLLRTQKVLEQERNIAQSATLSNLAKRTLEVDSLNKNRDFIFQLAAKSWELNHDNKQACNILYEFDDNNYKTPKDTSEHNQYIERLINNVASQKGRFDDEYLSVIFEKHYLLNPSANSTLSKKVKILYEESSRQKTNYMAGYTEY